MFYNLYCALCEQKGVSPSRAALDIGISKSLPTSWKTTGTKPKSEILTKIADYFGVSVDYLLGNEKSAPAGDGETAEMSEEDAQMKALADKIGQLSESKRKILENLLDAMLEE